MLSTAAGGWKQIIGQEAAMLNQIQSLAEVVDKIDSKEDLYSERAKFDLERSFSVSITTPSGSPYTGKSRSESCKSRQSFSSRHSSVDTDCLLESDRNTISQHSLSQVYVFLQNYYIITPIPRKSFPSDLKWVLFSSLESLILSKFCPMNGFIGVVLSFCGPVLHFYHQSD